jgi:SulP family sulfate permease
VLEIGNLYAIQIGLLTLIAALVARQVDAIRNWAILIGVAAGTAYSAWLNSRIGLENTLVEQIANLSAVGFVFPSVPLFNQEALPDIISILPGAVTLALLGLFQTVAAMRRMNRKIGGFTDSRKAILSDALSNCVLPFLSSLPTCASFNRMWLVYRMGGQSRITSVLSALFLLLMVVFLADAIAIIPMPAMAAIIMLLGANMICWEDIKPHLKNRREMVVFTASFLSVLLLDLFGAVLVGSILAIAYSKWEQAHPNVSLRGNVLKIRGNIYYGSLPVIEATYHRAIGRLESLVIDFSECYYIDPEGVRWLAAAKAGHKVGFVDRRTGQDRRGPDAIEPRDRRDGEERRNAEAAAASDRRAGEDRRAALRRRKRDRRQRSEF